MSLSGSRLNRNWWMSLSGSRDPRTDRSGTASPDLRHPDDPDGWRAFTVQDHVAFAEHVASTCGCKMKIVMDSVTQDSASTPVGGREVVHEYRLRVTADPRSERILSINAEPRVLPSMECVGAKHNVARMLDVPLWALRERVLADLRGTAGCTHLNDALRALAEVPALVNRLSLAEGAA